MPGGRLVTQSCRTLCDPMHISPPGSSVHGISQAKNTGVGCHFLLHSQALGKLFWNDNKVVRPNEPGIMTLLYHAAFAPSDKVLEYRQALTRWNAQTAADAMTAPAICVSPEDTIETVGRVMLDDKVKRVFVAEEGHLLGVISRSVFVELLLKE